MDLVYKMAFTTLLALIENKRDAQKFLRAFRKLYLALHEARASFLTPEDTVKLGMDRIE
jgi:hypothetical protein